MAQELQRTEEKYQRRMAYRVQSRLEWRQCIQMETEVAARRVSFTERKKKQTLRTLIQN